MVLVEYESVACEFDRSVEIQTAACQFSVNLCFYDNLSVECLIFLGLNQFLV